MPDHPYLLLNQARAVTFLGRYIEAEISLNRLKSLEPLPPGSDLAIRAGSFLLDGKRGDKEAALAGAALLAEEGSHLVAGILFVEFDDPRAKEQFTAASANPLPRDRVVSSWLYPRPDWATDPIVKPYLESLGYTDEWRREICSRAIDYAAGVGVSLCCEDL